MLSKREVFDVICSNCFGDLFFLLTFISLWVYSEDNKLILIFIFFSQLETFAWNIKYRFLKEKKKVKKKKKKYI